MSRRGQIPARAFVTRSLALRVMMVPLFVAFCYLFDWWWLRIATTLALVKMSALLGFTMHRLGPDLVGLDAMRVQFIVPCTMVDAFLGAIPLLWRTRAGWLSNLGRLSIVFSGVFCLNAVRLESGFFAMHLGAPWWLAHECVAGVAYFCLFLLIVKQRAWETAQNDAGKLHTPAIATAGQTKSIAASFRA